MAVFSKDKIYGTEHGPYAVYYSEKKGWLFLVNQGVNSWGLRVPEETARFLVDRHGLKTH